MTTVYDKFDESLLTKQPRSN